MKERAERAREHRDDGYRVRLEEDVEHARGGGDGVWQLGRDGQELRARPEQCVAEIGDLGAARMALEGEDQNARYSVQEQRRDDHECDAGAQMLMRRRRPAHDVVDLLDPAPSDGLWHRPSIPDGSVANAADGAAAP